MNIFKKRIYESLNRHIKADESLIEIPPDSSLGDFAIPCFTFAREQKKSPAAIAEELAGKIKPDELIAEVRNTGPYLNFFINKARLAGDVLGRIIEAKGSYGRSKDNKTIMVEYSSPNTNKPLHLGHVRNIVIGKSMSNILAFKGNRVIQSCLVNDRGIHISKSMLAYQRWGKDREPDRKADHFVGDFYVMFNEKVKSAPELEEEAQDLLRRWENGDSDVKSLWKKMNSWAEKGFNETYTRLGIKFDRFYHESDIYDKGRDIVGKGLEDGIFKNIDGAITAELEDFSLPDKVLVRADGTTLYMTQDIYLAIRKFKDFNLDRSIYVVGSEQNMHFAQLFAILEKLGSSIVKDCHHLSYGMVYLPEGRMKSREGTVVDADTIIDDMLGLARAEVEKRYERLDEKETQKRSEVIGLGALKFFMLRTDPGKDMTFDPKESISFEGETGPYVQYAYARISSILKKHGKVISDSSDYDAIGAEETELVRQLSLFPDIVSDSARYKPSAVCRYLLDLSQRFNEYYHKVPILKAPEKQKRARLLLIFCIREVLRSGLGLLDIGVLEEM